MKGCGLAGRFAVVPPMREATNCQPFAVLVVPVFCHTAMLSVELLRRYNDPLAAVTTPSGLPVPAYTPGGLAVVSRHSSNSKVLTVVELTVSERVSFHCPCPRWN